ncbi:MAG: T9SS type A sorting domain-containing protein [Bacteroidia bacterium]
MKTFMQFLVRGLMAAAMVLGMGEVLGQRHGFNNNELDIGNPEEKLCEEPCGVPTRRFVQMSYYNNLNRSVRITNMEFASGAYKMTSAPGQLSILDLHSSKVISIPQHWNSTWTSSTCASNTVIVPQKPLPPVSSGSACFSVVIPPKTTYYFILELSITFRCPWDMLAGTTPQQHAYIPKGKYPLNFNASIDFDTLSSIAFANSNGNRAMDEEYPPFEIDFGCIPEASQWRVARPSLNIIEAKLGQTVTSNWTTLILNLRSPENTELELYSTNGKMVQSIWKNESLPSGKTEHRVGLENLPDGMYYLKLKGHNFQKVMKVIKI